MTTTAQTTTQRTPEYWNLVADMLSQAVTGELIGMANFASLVETIDDPEEMMEAVEHAESERGHAVAFSNLAKKYGLPLNVNIQGEYWRRVREAFLKWAKRKDFAACLMIQEVMLESFAVSMYHDAGNALPDDLGRVFTAISKEEEGHLEHSIELLRAEMERDPQAFIEKMHEVHLDCMTVLAELSAKKDIRGHCGVCQGACMKDSLHHVNLNMASIRGNAMNLYLQSLDRIGLPGEKTILWVANLPF